MGLYNLLILNDAGEMHQSILVWSYTKVSNFSAPGLIKSEFIHKNSGFNGSG